jgi:tetratricopeptide (TPR) repeat protein
LRNKSIHSWRNSAVLLVILTAAFVFSGCVYYNTFYNAERAYQKAEKSRREQEARQLQTREFSTTTTEQTRARSRVGSVGDAQSYRLAIEKSAKVLAYYPNSPYIDDALLLMAKSYYHLEEFAPALRKCSELLAAFPQSPMAAEARYWEGMALWRLDREEEASISLTRIAGDDNSPFQGDAAFALAQLKRNRGVLQEAIAYYRIAVRRAHEAQFRNRARRELGACLIEAKQFNEALAVDDELIRQPQPAAQRYEIYLRKATTQRAMVDYEGALATLRPLVRDQRYTEQIPRTRLEIARTQEETGAVEAAILLYQQIIEDVERSQPVRAADTYQTSGSRGLPAQRVATQTAETAEANYRLGRLQESRYNNYANAVALYTLASQGPASDVASLAKVRLDEINKWDALHRSLTDTTRATNEKSRRELIYALAEHHLFSMNEPDSALEYFAQIVAGPSDSAIWIRAQYALGWVLRSSLRDTVRSDSVWQSVLTDSVRTAVAFEVKDAIRAAKGLRREEPGLPLYRRAESGWLELLERVPPTPPDSISTDSAASAEWWTLWSERQRTTGGSYPDLFREVVEKFPSGALATRARFILGWYAENVLNDTAAARQWFAEAQLDSVHAPEIARMAHLRNAGSQSYATAPADTLGPSARGATAPDTVSSPHAPLPLDAPPAQQDIGEVRQTTGDARGADADPLLPVQRPQAKRREPRFETE